MSTSYCPAAEAGVAILRNPYDRQDPRAGGFAGLTRRPGSGRLSGGPLHASASGTLPAMHADILALGAIVLVVTAAWGWFLVRGSTAVPAAAWAVGAAAVFLLEAIACRIGWLNDPATHASLRLVGAALAVCPTMALLGAKRPQHGVWQFIVGSLAFVLALPALSALLVRPGSLPDVHLLERGFLALLLIVGWMNFVATRHALAATLVTGGLVVFVRAFLPGGDSRPTLSAIDAAAAGGIAVGATLALGQSMLLPARGAGETAGIVAAIDRPYLALRETLGAAWTLRIAERFNAVATRRSWPCQLRFGGLVVERGAEAHGWEREAARCCRALLLRFVSESWLARHGGLPPAKSPESS